MFLFYLTGGSQKVSLGDLGSGHAFDNGCNCFDSCTGVVKQLKGQKTECTCNVSRPESIILSMYKVCLLTSLLFFT